MMLDKQNSVDIELQANMGNERAILNIHRLHCTFNTNGFQKVYFRFSIRPQWTLKFYNFCSSRSKYLDFTL